MDNTFSCFAEPCFEVIETSPPMISKSGRSQCWQIKTDLESLISKISRCDFVNGAGICSLWWPDNLPRHRHFQDLPLFFNFCLIQNFCTFAIKGKGNFRIINPDNFCWRAIG